MMTNSALKKTHLARMTFVFALFWFCLYPQPAAADAETVGLVGIVGNCNGDLLSNLKGLCNSFPGTFGVTGTYSFDSNTLSIVGPWSFSTPFGSMSGTGGSVLPLSDFEPGNVGNVLRFQSLVGEFIDLGFSGANAGDGQVLTHVSSCCDLGFNPSIISTTAGGGVTQLDFISGTASPVATPEPPSLVSLSMAMVVLVPLIRRRCGQLR